MEETVDTGEFQDVVESLSQSVDWALNFLNGMGGDYSVINASDKEVILQNQSSCPSFCSKKENRLLKQCSDIEKSIDRGVKFIGSEKVSACFTKCSCDEGTNCELKINFHRSQVSRPLA